MKKAKAGLLFPKAPGALPLIHKFFKKRNRWAAALLRRVDDPLQILALAYAQGVVDGFNPPYNPHGFLSHSRRLRQS